MKHFFSCIASLAMLFISFCLVSCVVINDSFEPDPEPETYYYSIEVLGSVEAHGIAHKFFQEKLGNTAEFIGGSGTGYNMIATTDKEKTDAIIKNLPQYNSELDNLLKANEKVNTLHYWIRYNKVTLYEYEYIREH